MLGMDCLVEQREHVSLTEHGVEGVLLVKVTRTESDLMKTTPQEEHPVVLCYSGGGC